MFRARAVAEKGWDGEKGGLARLSLEMMQQRRKAQCLSHRLPGRIGK